MHQLLRENLHNNSKLDQFFDTYLGKPILKRFEDLPVPFSKWTEETREALRALCFLYAEAIPEADHVVREDAHTPGHAPTVVGGELLLYLGIKGSPAFQRGQFTGIALANQDDSATLITYIAGSANEERRLELIDEEDPDKRLDGLVIKNVGDVENLKTRISSVLKIQRTRLIEQKRVNNFGTFGFCPAFCQKVLNRENRLSEKESGDIFLAFWRQRQNEISSEQYQHERTLMTENNRIRYSRVVAYVRERVPVELAYQLALEEHMQ